MAAGEFTPGGSKVRMTKAQVRKYIADMKAAQEVAKKKLEIAELGYDAKKDEKELTELEEKIDEIL